ncbi:hypothetical protein FACS189483_01470 [Spirochaetia bacterium]|nr:hypothetical protein FACS189483_01470 [Spirochaetia bacterium]
MASGGRQRLTRAIQAGVRRDYGEAVRILEELISQDDAPPEAYLFLGRSLHALKDYSRALAAFNDYIRICPRSSEGYRFAGRTYLTAGMPQRAAPFLKKALDLHPDDVLTMALLGTAYLKSKHSAEAVEILQQAVETAAQNRPGKPPVSAREQQRIYRAYLNALLIRGIRLCRLEEYDLGIQMLSFVLDNGIDSPLLRLELGRSCRELGRLDAAVEHYTQALAYAPEDTRIRWYRASVLMGAGRNAEALEEIERIRSSGEALPDLPWNSELVDRFMISSFLETGEWRRASEAARVWLKNQGAANGPDQAAARAAVHAMYAEAQRNLGEYAAAQNHLNRALDLEPNRIQLWYALILTAWEGEDWTTLKKALKRARDLEGESDIVKRFSILLKAKTALKEGGDDREILATLQEAVRALGPEPDLMYALGKQYLKTGLIEAAIIWFKKVRNLQDDHEQAYLGEIVAYEALSNEGEAGAEAALRAVYDTYLERWPDNYPLRRDRALFLVHLGEFEEATLELERLLAWEPANQTLRRVLAYGYRKTGRYREAAFFLKGLLKEKPRDVELLLEYTGCLKRAGAAKYAIAVLEKALPYIETSADIPIALGMLYYREKKFERAFDRFREAAARNSKDPRPWQWMAVMAKSTGDAEGARKYTHEADKRTPKTVQKMSKQLKN